MVEFFYWLKNEVGGDFYLNFLFFFFLTVIFGLFDRFLENPFSCTVGPKNAMSVKIDDTTSGTSERRWKQDCVNSTVDVPMTDS